MREIEKGSVEFKENWETLFEAACQVRNHAYAPYSGFFVGAAVMDDEGGVHIGCNVENASYRITDCAEQGAVDAMIAAGKRRIRRVCVVLAGGCLPGGSPCGACRQKIWEFCGGDRSVEVLTCDPEAKTARLFTIGELLSDPFIFKTVSQ
jgi:cytidine deaminase